MMNLKNGQVNEEKIVLAMAQLTGKLTVYTKMVQSVNSLNERENMGTTGMWSSQSDIPSTVNYDKKINFDQLSDERPTQVVLPLVDYLPSKNNQTADYQLYVLVMCKELPQLEIDEKEVQTNSEPSSANLSVSIIV